MKLLFTAFLSLLVSNSFCQGKWTKKLDLPDTVRIEACSFATLDKGYLVAGRQGTIYFNDVWEFDPIKNSWLQKANFPGAARREPVAFTINGKGYIGTGRNAAGAMKDFWEYDPAKDTWLKKADYPGGVRRDATGFSIGNKGYIGTGQDPTGSVNKNDFWEYDPATDKWTQKTNFPGTARNAAIGFSVNNKGYIGLGRNSSVEYSDFYEYNPTDNSWTKRADFTPGTREEVVSFVLGNLAYIGTGYSSSATAGSKADFWAFNSQANTWSKIDTLKGVARTEATSFEIGGKGYITTGSSITGPLNDLWEYDPSTLAIEFDEFVRENITLYPNPTTNQVTVNFNSSTFNQPLSFNLLTSNGKHFEFDKSNYVLNESNKVIVNTESLANGIYFLTISTPNKSITLKIMVIK